MENKKNEIWFERILIVIIFLGITASVINLFNNRSLWLDEAALSLNIINKSYWELLKPLDLSQVAPIGFLYIEKFFTTVFGDHDWSLRIFPFLSYILSIPLFFLFNKRLFNSIKFALLSSAIFSLSITLIYFSSEVKQYSTDVLIALIIAVSALQFQYTKTKKSLILFTLVGVLSIWFSNISIIMLFTVGLYSLYTTFLKGEKKNYIIFIPILSWLLSFFIYYTLFILNHPHNEVMLNYWSNKKAFLPQNIFASDFYIFLFSKTRLIFSHNLRFGSFWVIPLLFFLIGILSLLKYRKIIFITLFPLFIHLIISSFKLYPFHDRFILYLTPFIITLFTAGLWSVYKYVNRYIIRIPLYVLLIPVFVNFHPLIQLIPIEEQEIKKSMAYINENIDIHDMIYVFYGSRYAFQFYKKDYPQIANKDSIILGKISKQDWSKYDSEILKLSDKSWLIFSKVYPTGPNENKEENYIVRTLEANGYQIIDKKEFVGSSLYEITK